MLNAAEVAEKMIALGDRRLRDTDADRAEKTRQWLGSVARKWLLREGEAAELANSGADFEVLANLPKWAQESLAQSLSVIRVVVSAVSGESMAQASKSDESHRSAPNKKTRL